MFEQRGRGNFLILFRPIHKHVSILVLLNFGKRYTLIDMRDVWYVRDTHSTSCFRDLESAAV